MGSRVPFYFLAHGPCQNPYLKYFIPQKKKKKKKSYTPLHLATHNKTPTKKKFRRQELLIRAKPSVLPSPPSAADSPAQANRASRRPGTDLVLTLPVRSQQQQEPQPSQLSPQKDAKAPADNNALSSPRPRHSRRDYTASFSS